MDDLYKPYYKRAMDLKYRLEDVVDDLTHPQIQQLKREVHGLVDDFETQKDPRHTENRLKTIEHELMQDPDPRRKTDEFQGCRRAEPRGP